MISKDVSTVIDVLQGPSAAILHANPELVAPEVTAKVGDDVLVTTVLHHQDLLLDYRKIIP